MVDSVLEPTCLQCVTVLRLPCPPSFACGRMPTDRQFPCQNLRTGPIAKVLISTQSLSPGCRLSSCSSRESALLVHLQSHVGRTTFLLIFRWYAVEVSRSFRSPSHLAPLVLSSFVLCSAAAVLLSGFVSFGVRPGYSLRGRRLRRQVMQPRFCPGRRLAYRGRTSWIKPRHFRLREAVEPHQAGNLLVGTKIKCFLPQIYQHKSLAHPVRRKELFWRLIA